MSESPTARQRAYKALNGAVSLKTLGLSGILGLAGVGGAVEWLVKDRIVTAAEAKLEPRIKALWERYRDLEERVRELEKER